MVDLWANIRKKFPGLESGTYLDTACHGLTATPTAEAVNKKFMDVMRFAPHSNGTEDTIILRESLDFARTELSKLLRSDPEEIALVENSTTALETLINIFGINEDEEILFCDLEFFGLVTPWRRTMGKKTFFPNSGGAFSVGDIGNFFTPRTKFLVLSGVQEITGFKAPLEKISELCRENDVTLFVDATQLVGSQAFFPGEIGLDFVFSSGFKWLNSPFGMGFLWIGKENLNSFSSCRWGYFNLREPSEGWDKYLADPAKNADFRGDPVSGASRFENGGTNNYGAAFALGTSVGMLNQIGIEKIHRRNQKLNQLLLSALNTTELTPYDFPEENQSSLTVASYREIKKTQALYQDLVKKKIKVSLRYSAGQGGLRIAPHFYNNEEDIAQFIEGVKNFEGN